MCIVSNKPIEKKIAQKNIQTIKLLRCDGKKLESPMIIAMYQKHFYEKDGFALSKNLIMMMLNLSDKDLIWKRRRTRKEDIKIECNKNGEYYTKSGLYSFKPGKVCKHGSSFKEFIAVIPKGSEYYEDDNQYCSEKLRIIKEYVH